MQIIDLHTHSSLSDGKLSPEELVKLAKEKKCTRLSITDHEIIKDHSDLSQKYHIDIIPGIEFNCSVSNMHILGYNIKNLDLVNTEMDSLRRMNANVCYQVIDKLRAEGYDISIDQIINYFEKINQKFDIIDKRKIVKYLIFKKYVENTFAAYQKLIGKNCAFYVPNHKMTPFEIINLINMSGGISVIAHPNTIKMPVVNQFELFEKLASYGLTGLEVINKKANTTSEVYIKMADELSLIKTFGSDFHNPCEDELGIEIDDSIYQDTIKVFKMTKKRSDAKWH